MIILNSQVVKLWSQEVKLLMHISFEEFLRPTNQFFTYDTLVFLNIDHPSLYSFLLPIFMLPFPLSRRASGVWFFTVQAHPFELTNQFVYWTAATLNSAVVCLPFVLPVPSSSLNKHNSAMCLKIHVVGKELFFQSVRIRFTGNISGFLQTESILSLLIRNTPA